MNEPKHTAGPWSSSAWGESARNVIVARDVDGNEIPVAVLLDTGLSPEAVAANRRLVKAAPLLWDACIAALGYLSGEGDDNPNPAREAVYHAIREAAGLSDVVDCLLWDEVNLNRESEDE